MGAIDINAFDYKSLPPEECDKLRQQAVRRAHLARGRALRHVIGSGVRALRAAAGAAAETVVTTARTWWRAYALWRERSRTVRELRALDDRTLRDIGVNRSEIEWVVSSQQAARVRAAVKAVRPRQHWPAPDRGTPAKPQQVGKGLTDKCAA